MNGKRSPHSLHGPAALVCAVVCMLFAITTSAQQTLPTRHVRPVVASGQAVLVGPVASTQIIQLAIILPIRNQPALTNLLGRLYDPSSPDYRSFLSATQFTDQFGPTIDDY